MVVLPSHDDAEYTQETRDASPAHLLMKIKSYSMLSKHKISELESMVFEAGDYKWKMLINFDRDEHISVNLCVVGTSSLPYGWEVNAMFNFFIYNHIADKYLCFRGKAQRFHTINPKRGFSNLITKKNLTKPSNGFLFKDKCVFGAEVFVIEKKPLIHKVSVLNLSSPYERVWEISNFSELGSIWKSEEFSAAGYEWKVMLYPNGSNSKKYGRYMGVRLKCVDAKSFSNHEKVSAECVFLFRNKLSDSEHHYEIGTALYTSTFPSWGLDDFIEIDDMLDSRKGFVVDDCCNLEIQLSVQALHDAPYVAGI